MGTYDMLRYAYDALTADFSKYAARARAPAKRWYLNEYPSRKASEQRVASSIVLQIRFQVPCALESAKRWPDQVDCHLLPSNQLLPEGIVRGTMAPTGSAPAPLRAPPTDFDAIVAEERSLLLPSFTSTDAFALGSLIRTRIPQWLPSAPPAVIHICLANSSNVLFHAITEPPSRQQGAGVVPDNDDWVRRKKAVVLRWGISSYAMHLKMKGDQEAFADKFMLAGEKKGEVRLLSGYRVLGS